jgi:hypothetical protein
MLAKEQFERHFAFEKKHARMTDAFRRYECLFRLKESSDVSRGRPASNLTLSSAGRGPSLEGASRLRKH